MSSLTAARCAHVGRLALTLLVVLGLAAGTVFAPGVTAHGHDDGPSGRPSGTSDPGTTSAGDPSETADAPADASSVANDGTATVASALNLRAAPSTDAEILTVMPAGATVQLGGDAGNGFVAVVFEGTNGYAAAQYIGVSDGATGATTDPSGAVPATISGSDDIVAIIYAAADAYGQSREDMLRVATCESGLDPNNVTPPYSASGLFQFLPSTWASTPYADQDIFDPVASAYAAAWMWSVGRRGEWVCQ